MASASYPDLKVPQYRIKRKPPPTVDIAERYPSPDPQNPFAPLSVLRNRTSSALGQNPAVQPTTCPSAYPAHGAFGSSQDTLNNPSPPTNHIARKRSNSFLTHTEERGLPIPHNKNVEEASSSSPEVDAKIGHYRSQPQLGFAAAHVSRGTRHGGPKNDTTALHDDSSPSETHIDLASTQRPWPAPKVDTRRPPVDLSMDSSGTETESDASGSMPLPGLNVKINASHPILHHVQPTLTTGKPNANPNATITPVPLRGGDSTANATSSSGRESSQSRLAKFLLPKKTSGFSHGHGSSTGGGDQRSNSRNGTANRNANGNGDSDNSASHDESQGSGASLRFGSKKRNHHAGGRAGGVRKISISGPVVSGVTLEALNAKAGPQAKSIDAHPGVPSRSPTPNNMNLVDKKVPIHLHVVPTPSPLGNGGGGNVDVESSNPNPNSHRDRIRAAHLALQTHTAQAQNQLAEKGRKDATPIGLGFVEVERSPSEVDVEEYLRSIVGPLAASLPRATRTPSPAPPLTSPVVPPSSYSPGSQSLSPPPPTSSPPHSSSRAPQQLTQEGIERQQQKHQQPQLLQPQAQQHQSRPLPVPRAPSPYLALKTSNTALEQLNLRRSPTPTPPPAPAKDKESKQSRSATTRPSRAPTAPPAGSPPNNVPTIHLPPKMFKRRMSSVPITLTPSSAGQNASPTQTQANAPTTTTNIHLTTATMTVVPSSHSISNTSIVNVSISTPSPSPGQSFSVEEDGVFTSPRPAPRPPPNSSKGLTASNSLVASGSLTVDGKGRAKTSHGMEKKRSVSPFMRGQTQEVHSEPELERTRERLEKERLDREREAKEQGEKEASKSSGKAKARAQSDDEPFKTSGLRLGRGRTLPAPPLTTQQQRTKHVKAASSSSGKTKGSLAGSGEGTMCSTGTCPTSVSEPLSFPVGAKHERGTKADAPQHGQQQQPNHPHPHIHTHFFGHRHAQASPSASSPFQPTPDENSGVEYVHPTPAQLVHAASLPLYAENGSKISFGALFAKQKTVVVFIRHFWCPLCQDYMTVVSDLVRPEMLVGHDDAEDDEVVWKAEGRGASSKDKERPERKRKAADDRIGFVVISNGAHGMIPKYRQMFNLPFDMYTDPSLALYKALGMARDGDAQREHDAKYHQHRSEAKEKGKEKERHFRKRADSSSNQSGTERGYVRHGLMGGIAMVVLRAIKVGMPVWEKGGDIGQLGGEFVLGPGLTCTYAHRMQSTKGHAPIQEVLHAAGVQNIPSPSRSISSLHKHNPHAHSIDLANLPHQKHPRKRRESMKTVQETLSRGPQATEGDTSGPSGASCAVGGVRMSRHSSRSYSTGMMTREEEERWMEDRQRDIDRLQEKKNVRRFVGPKAGELNRSGSAMAGPSIGVPLSIITPGSAAKDERKVEHKSRTAPKITQAHPLEEERIVYKADDRRQDTRQTQPHTHIATPTITRTPHQHGQRTHRRRETSS